MKVVLDTNILVSYLISSSFNEIDNLLFQKKIELAFSDELIAEFLDVVHRPKLRKYFSESDIQSVLNFFREYGQLVPVHSSLNICRDENDNFLINLAVDAEADYLISGDEDLLILEKVWKTKIVSYSDFIKIEK